MLKRNTGYIRQLYEDGIHVLDEAKNDEGQRGGPHAVKNKNG